MPARCALPRARLRSPWVALNPPPGVLRRPRVLCCVLAGAMSASWSSVLARTLRAEGPPGLYRGVGVAVIGRCARTPVHASSQWDACQSKVRAISCLRKAPSARAHLPRPPALLASAHDTPTPTRRDCTRDVRYRQLSRRMPLLHKLRSKQRCRSMCVCVCVCVCVYVHIRIMYVRACIVCV